MSFCQGAGDPFLVAFYVRLSNRDARPKWRELSGAIRNRM
jgi:hypothetical protein